jgi:gas vesicle protein
MGNNGIILSAFLAGAVAGVIVGILFAPSKGSDTRQMIVDGSVHLAEDIYEKAEEGMSALNELREKYLSTIPKEGGKGHHAHN